MSKFCTNCGAQLSDEAAFCANCGAPVGGQPAPQPTPDSMGQNFDPAMQQPAPVAEQQYFDPNAGQPVQNQFQPNFDPAMQQPAYAGGYAPIPAPKKNKKPLWIALAAVAVVIIAAVCIILFSGSGGASSPEKAVMNYLNFSTKLDLDQLEGLAPKQFWTYIEDKEDKTFSDIKKEMSEELEDGDTQELRDYLAKISYEVKNSKKCDDSTLEDYRDGFNDKYGFDKDLVQAVYELEVEVKLEDESDSETVNVVKFAGSYYVADSSGFAVDDMF